jgi:hypothetical protein
MRGLGVGARWRSVIDRLAGREDMNGTIARGVFRVMGILWLVVVVGLALVLAVRLKQEPLGRYDIQSCHLVWYGQVPQLLTGAAGAAVLIVSAELHRLRPMTVVIAAAIAAAWALELWLLPPMFDKVCAN